MNPTASSLSTQTTEQAQHDQASSDRPWQFQPFQSVDQWRQRVAQEQAEQQRNQHRLGPVQHEDRTQRREYQQRSIAQRYTAARRGVVGNLYSVGQRRFAGCGQRRLGAQGRVG